MLLLKVQSQWIYVLYSVRQYVSATKRNHFYLHELLVNAKHCVFFIFHTSIFIFLLFFIIVRLRPCDVNSEYPECTVALHTAHRLEFYAISIVVFFRNNFGYVRVRQKKKKLKLEIHRAISIEQTIRRHRECVHVVVCGIKESTRTSYPHDINCTDETSSDFCFPTS